MMKQEPIPITLRDGTCFDVIDCEYDLLLRLLYKYEFDMRAVEEEIEFICNQITADEKPNLLLKRGLLQFASELSNKITVRSFTEGVDHRKIVADMIVDVAKISYSIAESLKDLRKVLKLRKKIFVDEEGYPLSGVRNGYEKSSLHLMANMGNELVGCVSIAFDGEEGIPLDAHFDLKKWRDKRFVEVDKLAVIGEKRKKELSFQLMWLCYSIAKFWGAQRMFIFTLSSKSDNIALYNRFGFKTMGEFHIFGSKNATALMLDFDDFSTYEKQLKTKELLRLGKKLLTKFSVGR